ncbi:MAG: glycosyltransferase family 2 protein [Planctomycetes bacterium]|jgi:glycosyltransferase involved in cell wall biosynthesis|nr:glycosyltransferase family 2 protein [Planctomycetota bacterium]MBT6540436.1 glycosyltransferase family 2 protein [Planctomycetota bacterium]MBT7104114.1 glycosyltransferase family 2 protein [Planctomycetota bacterium]MBT7129220.1 glycosyltransferase family 2 protein [Planctomycetota bacterium]
MIDLTATVITFNEEGNIRECLESLRWVPNIVVVDSGSTDRTVEIAREFTDRVHVTDWPGHVEQKNRAVDLAPTDWIISLDADERVTPELRAELEHHLDHTPSHRGYSMPRLTRHLGRWIRHGGWYPDRKIRVFDRRSARWAGTNPHDHISLDGSAFPLKGDLLHYSFDHLHHHMETIDFFTSISAREMEGTKRSAIRGMALRAPWKFLRMYLLDRGYRDGFAGFILAAVGSFYVFLKYAVLWERRSLRARGIDPDRVPRHHRGPEWRPPRALPESAEAKG